MDEFPFEVSAGMSNNMEMGYKAVLAVIAIVTKVKTLCIK